MRKLGWILDRLPGVRPRLASVAIKNGAVAGAMDDMHFIHGDFGPAMLVGPDAARLILDAYQAGRIPMIGKPTDAPEVTAYLADEMRLRAEADRHRLAQRGSDPFADWRSMEEIFRQAGHPVPVHLEISGVTVE